MGLIDRILGRRPDPTKDWPQLSNAPTGFDLSRRTFGSLAFGDGFESARQFGKPDKFEWIRPGYCTLLYARSGFQIDFEDGRFSYIAFLLGPDMYLPAHPQLAFSEPWLCDRLQLSSATNQLQIKNYFGAPESEDVDSDETILFYSHNNMTIEFEFTPTDSLKRCNLFPK